MHYFYDSEAALKHFLHNVALNLRPGQMCSWPYFSADASTPAYSCFDTHAGGIFMGTIPCGKRVISILGEKDVFSSVMLRLEKRWKVGSDRQVHPTILCLPD